MSSIVTDLGIGVGLRPAHYDHFMTRAPSSVSWVEVISENFLEWENGQGGGSFETLAQIRRNIPVVLHGVSLSIGSADPLSKPYLRQLKKLIQKVEPSWVSDHLCWTGVQGKNLHDLMPLPYTEEALDQVVSKLLQVQDFLGRRILIENVSSYFQFEHSEMTEWDFVNEVVTRADCGLLLDINNVYVSSVNHSFDAMDYLKAISKERVGQIHLAGHTQRTDYLVDTHDSPVCEEVWQLYSWAMGHFGSRSTMIERDANIPEWSELEEELVKAAFIRDQSILKIRALTARKNDDKKNSTFHTSEAVI